MKLFLRSSVLWLAVVVMFPDSAFGQDVNKPVCKTPIGIDRPLQLGLLYDNDFFASSDRHYTSGAMLSLTWGNYETASSDPCRSEQARRIAKGINGLLEPSLSERHFVFSVGQQLYTPSLRRRTGIQLNDRPFAGWLFGRWALHAFDTDRSQTLSLDLGLVGPAAGGEASQNFFHGLQGYTPFRGWGNQLRNEVGVLVAHESRREILKGSSTSLIGHYGGGLGNIETYLNTGLRLQFGADLLNDFRRPPSFRPASAIGRINTGSESSNSALQGFVGFDLRGVAHNIFLDGNTWAQSHRVDRKPGVAEFSAGISWQWGGVDFAYTHTLRGREFYGQTNNHAFGSLSISKTIP